MNCKNCNTELKTAHKYCHECGAKIVEERITIKSLLSTLLISFGWDNQFFGTLRDLVLRPQIVFEKYLNGTRKRYTNPFAFFAIGVALSVFVINIYTEELINISSKDSLKPAETVYDSLNKNETNLSTEKNTIYLEQQKTINNGAVNFQYKYYYYLSFLLLPFYAFISFLVFGKPENFGEHLVINAYIQGLSLLIILPLFFITLFLDYDIHTAAAILLTIIYYSYAYKKYRKYTFGQSLKKLLKFFAIILVVLLFFVGIGILVGMSMDK